MSRLSSHSIVSIIIIILLSLITYWNTLDSGFIWDDDFAIETNKAIRSLDPTSIKTFFTSSDPYNFAKGQNYRPVSLISFAVIYKLFGLNPFGYHLSNVVLHTINGVMIFLFASLLFNDRRRRSMVHSSWFTVHDSPAFIAAILFAAHPIHTEAVAWIKELDDLLALFFMLIAFCLYIKSTLNSQLLTRNYLFSLFFYILAILSKEMVVTLPILLLLYDFTLGNTVHGSRFTVRHFIRYIPFCLITLVYLIMRTLALGQVGEDEYLIVSGVVLKGIPKFFTMAKGIAYYIKLLVLPINLSADYLTFPVSLSMDWQVLLSISILLAMLAAAVISYRYSRIVTFSILWFFITILPVSNIIPLRIAIAERFLYLPSIGFCLLLAVGLTRVWKVRPLFGKVAAAVFVVITLFYSFGTIDRNRVWKDEYSFWSDLVERFPDNARAHHNLGAAYLGKGLLNESLKAYQEAIRLAPDYQEAHYHAGDIYRRMGRLEDAVNEYRTALLIDPAYVDVYKGLGLVFYQKGEYDEAISSYKRALEIESDNVDVHYNLANVYRRKGLTDKAMYEYEEVLKFDDSYYGAYSNIGVLYAIQGRYDEAVKKFKVALVLSPDDKKSRFNLGFAYMKMGDCEAARVELDYLLKSDPEDIRVQRLIDGCKGGSE
ncbi:MAG: tetratricopeptide repeat protein [Thermodesulfobacteriota bacterium]